jgi:UDP-perosamine 4-acetyltransferase
MSIAKTMIMFGGGGHAAVVIESARAAGFVVLGFLSDPAPAGAGDEEPQSGEDPQVMGLKRLGAISDFATVLGLHRHANFHAAVGDAVLREKWLAFIQTKDVQIPPVIHPGAAVSPSAKIAEGAFVGPRAVINARATIGRGAIINSGAIVEHDCVIAPFAHVAPGSVLSGGVQIGKATLIGAGSVIIPKVKIGAGCTLAAGAVAIADVPDGATAIGVPARVAEG